MIRMKSAPAMLLTLLLRMGVFAQDASQSQAGIQGLVTKDPDSQPVKKALIELIAENQAEGGNYATLTGPDGAFRIENIMPGRYHLFAERRGLLDISKEQGHTEGHILDLAAGQQVRDLHLRLQAAAVVHGRVTDEDGDPLPGAEVNVLRQTYVAGHKHWQQAGAERTNDLGEYRVANLAEGNVYISVNPPPDFKGLIEHGGAAASETRNPKAGPSASTTYQTTYYPGTVDRSQATPIPLHPGDEFPADFTLTPSPSLSIRGSVLNMPPRASATILLEARDFSLIWNGAEIHKDGSFVIPGVSPGSYTILASIAGTPVPMTARQSLEVGSTNVEGLRLSLQPGTTIQGSVRVESKNGGGRFDPGRVFLALESADGEQDELTFVRETFSNLAHVAPDGSFQWSDVPAGKYYVLVVGDSAVNEGWFVKSVAAGGNNISDSGLTVSGGTVAMDMVISTNGGTVEGVAVDHKGEALANAVIVAVPEARWRNRTDRYRKTVADQNGQFSLRGLPPGDYTVFAWESVDGEAYYNPDFLKAAEGQGSPLRISEGDRKSVELEAIPAAENHSSASPRGATPDLVVCYR